MFFSSSLTHHLRVQHPTGYPWRRCSLVPPAVHMVIVCSSGLPARLRRHSRFLSLSYQAQRQSSIGVGIGRSRRVVTKAMFRQRKAKTWPFFQRVNSPRSPRRHTHVPHVPFLSSLHHLGGIVTCLRNIGKNSSKHGCVILKDRRSRPGCTAMEKGAVLSSGLHETRLWWEGVMYCSMGRPLRVETSSA